MILLLLENKKSAYARWLKFFKKEDGFDDLLNLIEKNHRRDSKVLLKNIDGIVHLLTLYKKSGTPRRNEMDLVVEDAKMFLNKLKLVQNPQKFEALQLSNVLSYIKYANFKNLLVYKRYDNFKHVVTALNSIDSKKDIVAQGSTKYQLGSNEYLYKIESYEAVCSVGAKTKWCVTTKNDPSYWNHYSEDNNFFVYINKGDKYAILFDKDLGLFDSAWNAEDRPLALNEVPIVSWKKFKDIIEGKYGLIAESMYRHDDRRIAPGGTLVVTDSEDPHTDRDALMGLYDLGAKKFIIGFDEDYGSVHSATFNKEGKQANYFIFSSLDSTANYINDVQLVDMSTNEKVSLPYPKLDSFNGLFRSNRGSGYIPMVVLSDGANRYLYDIVDKKLVSSRKYKHTKDVSTGLMKAGGILLVAENPGKYVDFYDGNGEFLFDGQKEGVVNVDIETATTVRKTNPIVFGVTNRRKEEALIGYDLKTEVFEYLTSFGVRRTPVKLYTDISKPLGLYTASLDKNNTLSKEEKEAMGSTFIYSVYTDEVEIPNIRGFINGLRNRPPIPAISTDHERGGTIYNRLFRLTKDKNNPLIELLTEIPDKQVTPASLSTDGVIFSIVISKQSKFNYFNMNKGKLVFRKWFSYEGLVKYKAEYFGENSRYAVIVGERKVVNILTGETIEPYFDEYHTALTKSGMEDTLYDISEEHFEEDSEAFSQLRDMRFIDIVECIVLVGDTYRFYSEKAKLIYEAVKEK